MKTSPEMAAAATHLNNSAFVTVLTGAGVSAESGVATFRGADGLWRGQDPTSLATPDAFRTDPLLVWEFYNSRRHKLAEVKPNAGHFALAQLEGELSGFGLITQNVDQLHQAAGNKRVCELHGNIWDVRCTGCKSTFSRPGIELAADPHCDDCGERLRPAVVWFGETLPAEATALADHWVSQCDVFIVIGTSALVYPAAGYIDQAKQQGAKIIEINIEATNATTLADVSLIGKSGVVLPQLMSLLR